MLNLLNRLIVSLLLVIIIAISVAVAVTPEGVASFAAARLTDVRVDTISVQHLLIGAVSIVLAVLCAVLLRFQWSQRRPTAIRLAGAGSTELATESVVERIKHEVSALPQIRQ